MTFLKCPVCPPHEPKRFDTSQLQDHLGVAHLDGFYIYQCGNCPNIYTSHYRALSHMKMKCCVPVDTDMSFYTQPLMQRSGKALKELNRLLNLAVQNYAKEAAEAAISQFGNAADGMQTADDMDSSTNLLAPQTVISRKTMIISDQVVPKATDDYCTVETSRDTPIENNSFSMSLDCHFESDVDVDVEKRDITIVSDVSNIRDDGNSSVHNMSLKQEEEVHIMSPNVDLPGDFDLPHEEFVYPPRKNDVDDPLTSGKTGYRTPIDVESCDGSVFYPDTTEYVGAVLATPGRISKYDVDRTLYLVDKNYTHSERCMKACDPKYCEWVIEVSRLITEIDRFYTDACLAYPDAKKKIDAALGLPQG